MMKIFLTLMLSFTCLTLLGCTHFGEVNSDKVVGYLNGKEIHCVNYGVDSTDTTTLYIPITNNKNMASSYENKKFIDQYNHSAIYQYEFKSGAFEDDNLVYVSEKMLELNHNNNQVFDENHHFTKDSQIGTYVLGQYHLSIYKMTNFWESDRLYIGMQDNTVESNTNLKEDNILAHYQNYVIHQLIFKANGIFDDDQYIYIAVSKQNDVIPLTNLYTTGSGNSSRTIRSTLLLMTKTGNPLNFNE